MTEISGCLRLQRLTAKGSFGDDRYICIYLSLDWNSSYIVYSLVKIY